MDAASRVLRQSGNLAPLLEQVPYARWLGLRAAAGGSFTGEGCDLCLPFSPKLIGSPALPAIHGGVIAAFMELTAQLAVLLALEQSRLPKGVDFSIDYLRPAQTVDSFARAGISRLGARVAHVEVRCWQADAAEPIALARAHLLLARPQARS